MARSAKPRYRKDRNAWLVTIAGVRHNLGPGETEAFRQFHSLTKDPRRKDVKRQSFAAVADAFLDWLQKHRASDTYE